MREKIDGEKNLANARRQNMVHLAQEKQMFQDKMTAQKHHFEEIMRAYQKAYDQKIAVKNREHDVSIKHVNTQHAKEVQSTIANQASFKAALQSRSEDPFYNITTLAPVLTDKLDHYEITVPVPEFEQQNVILSGYKRSLKLTHARRAANEVELPDGSMNKSKRSESFTKEFPVTDIVEPEKIERHYAEGMLTFKIRKA